MVELPINIPETMFCAKCYMALHPWVGVVNSLLKWRLLREQITNEKHWVCTSCKELENGSKI